MRSGFVAVAGRPNVGKSTLVNGLCGGKVAIVSDKPQTTRRRIVGIDNGADHQLILVDLPGFQRPRDALTARMQQTVDRSLDDVEAILFVLSARERIGGGDRFIAERVFGLRVPVVIALNKVDRLKPGHIAEQMQRAAQLGDFQSLHPVSALTGDGVQELQLTREEVPHALSVEVEELTEKVVRATIFVETDSQKQIVIGKGGSVVKQIGTRARPEIELLLGHSVFLELKVKARPRWRRDEAMLERLGL